MALAKEFGGEIINADSMQVYKNLNVGTAKPTAEERQGIPHHLLDFLTPETPYSVADFTAAAAPLITRLNAQNRLPLVVGEFAADHGANGDVDEHSILRLTHENCQGCLGWSWKGNMPPLEGLDAALTWGGDLSSWGRTLVESEFGLRSTARKASVFDSRDR